MNNKVKEHRLMQDVSQSELAHDVGVSVEIINALETEQFDVSVSLARKLAVYFRCEIEDLFQFEDNAHTLVDKAMWYVHVVNNTAEVLGKPVWETAKLLEYSKLGEPVIKGYDVWHTQGYEYMGEFLSGELRNRGLDLHAYVSRE